MRVCCASDVRSFHPARTSSRMAVVYDAVYYYTRFATREFHKGLRCARREVYSKCCAREDRRSVISRHRLHHLIVQYMHVGMHLCRARM